VKEIGEAMSTRATIATVLFLSASAVSAADLTIVSKISGSMNSTVTTYMTANATRSNDNVAHADSITDFRNGIIYHISHKTKTIVFTKMADVPALIEAMKARQPAGGKGMAEFNAGMNNVYGDPSIFKVESVGRDTVIGRSCNKTRITSGNLVWEYCIDPTLRSPIDPASMLKATKAAYAGLSAYPSMARIMNNLSEATSKLNGVPLKTHMSGYNGDTFIEVTSIATGSIPASTFALPAGYTMKDQIALTRKSLEASHHH
jgi:hypothetical protein